MRDPDSMPWYVLLPLVILSALVVWGCEETPPGTVYNGWEVVDRDVCRRRVPGGWLYRYWWSGGSSIAFVPEPPAEKEAPRASR